ncbi:MAG: hypothetical protein ACRENQ_16685, partial [Gemmatimonadaceae bacterium]
MRKLTGIIAGLMLVCGVAGTAAAQRGGTMGQGRNPGVGRGRAVGGMRAEAARGMFRGITLTDAQKTALRDAREASRTQLQRNLRGVLTPDQQKVFDANRTRMARRVVRAGRMRRARRRIMRRHAMRRGVRRNRGRRMSRGRGAN